MGAAENRVNATVQCRTLQYNAILAPADRNNGIAQLDRKCEQMFRKVQDSAFDSHSLYLMPSQPWRSQLVEQQTIRPQVKLDTQIKIS